MTPTWVQIALEELACYQWQARAFQPGPRRDLAIIHRDRLTKELNGWADRGTLFQ